MKNKFTLALAFSVATLTAFAQTPDKTKLDKYFSALETNNKFMGSVAVSQNGKTVYTRSVGVYDYEKGLKTNENTKFRIGSISKMFTAALVLKAVEENKLKLSDKLSAYFPQVPNAEKITIANMLNHHSGIHNFTSDPEYMSYMSQPKTEAELAAIIAKAPADFEPGTKGEYSNSNFVLLSYILEKAYKKPYKTIVSEKIIKPLGLKNTYYGVKTNTANNEAYSYSYDGKWNKEAATDMSIPMGAGAIVSTSTDLSRFIEGLFAGRIISAASLEQMKTLQDNYGMGLFEHPNDSKKGYGHDGAIDGFTSSLVYYPEEKVTMALTSNGYNNYENEKISQTCMNWLHNKPFDVPEFKIYSYSEDELNSLAGTYTTEQMPVSFTIAKNGSALTAQASGQGAFPLESEEKNIFKFDAAGITITFNPDAKNFIITQHGNSVTFTKKA